MSTQAENSAAIKLIQEDLNDQKLNSKFPEELTLQSVLKGSSVIAIRYDDGGGFIDFHITAQQLIDSLNGTINTVSSNYSASAHETVLCIAASGAFTVTLPVAASSEGVTIIIKKIDAGNNTITIDGDGTELVEGEQSIILTSPGESVTLKCDGTAWFIV